MIKEYALGKKFDILLVFMFDRIGRIADETPFVVERLVRNGIRVVSVTEGEQKSSARGTYTRRSERCTRSVPGRQPIRWNVWTSSFRTKYWIFSQIKRLSRRDVVSKYIQTKAEQADTVVRHCQALREESVLHLQNRIVYI